MFTPVKSLLKGGELSPAATLQGIFYALTISGV